MSANVVSQSGSENNTIGTCDVIDASSVAIAMSEASEDANG